MPGAGDPHLSAVGGEKGGGPDSVKITGRQTGGRCDGKHRQGTGKKKKRKKRGKPKSKKGIVGVSKSTEGKISAP